MGAGSTGGSMLINAGDEDEMVSKFCYDSVTVTCSSFWQFFISPFPSEISCEGAYVFGITSDPNKVT